MALTRRLYLVIFGLLVVAIAGTGLYLRHRTIKAAAAAAQANCETPAPPPPPTTPPPKLPGFELEAGCGAAAATPKAADGKAKP